jgi:hypothetical protein
LVWLEMIERFWLRVERTIGDFNDATISLSILAEVSQP